ncbi:nitrite reductase small subunit NirD [Aeromicrobium sp. CTD01-1L150]|uniref:nitrite reductase small subunit NirD n=1 Tax=Aeromicrobium sp. CTD01-1L150 TaxID=3341830 RepID=UPI0035BFDD02
MTTHLESVVSTHVPVCRLADLHPDRGVAALVDRCQVAIFLLSGTREVLAVSHRDPFTGANVIARGLVGSRNDVPTVTSPLHKQVFDLRTGRCLDEPEVSLQTWPVRVTGDVVEIGGPGAGL